MIDNISSKIWRRDLGFTNQTKLKDFFKATDSEMIPKVDYEYINNLNQRIIEIIEKISTAIDSNIPVKKIGVVKDEIKILQNTIIQKINTMNNNGRRKEEVYFSWMRGQTLMDFFIPCLEYIFDSKIIKIGDDNETNWIRTPKADLETTYNNKKIRLEIQTGFQGINDIKKHKVKEAKFQLEYHKIETFVIHFDFFNGLVAFVNISTIDDADINWISRERLEGQTVFNISSNYFIWKLTEAPIKFQKICQLME